MYIHIHIISCGPWGHGSFRSFLQTPLPKVPLGRGLPSWVFPPVLGEVLWVELRPNTSILPWTLFERPNFSPHTGTLQRQSAKESIPISTHKPSQKVSISVTFSLWRHPGSSLWPPWARNPKNLEKIPILASFWGPFFDNFLMTLRL